MGVESVIPLPAGPLRHAPLAVACWLAAGDGLIWWMSATGRDGWTLSARDIFEERREPAVLTLPV